MPTKKSQPIESPLTSLTGISRQDAPTQRICTCCRKPVTPFRNRLSAKEYSISGMCQTCQDDIFEEEL